MKNKLTKRLFLVLILISICYAGYFIWLNHSVEIDTRFFTTSEMPVIIPFSIIVGAITLWFILLFSALCTLYSLGSRKTISAHSRKAEKASLDAEENNDRVKLLENKIKTLEIALQEALKKK